jgi:hypothetical protein
MRDLAIPVDEIDTSHLLREWSWILPSDHVPLFVGAFGDVVFGAPHGSLWLLSMLDGDYRLIANDALEYNRKKRDFEVLEDWFLAGWVEIAERHGLVPKRDECLGWKVHPALGAPFSVENIDIFSVGIYHLLVGQLFKQVVNPAR